MTFKYEEESTNCEICGGNEFKHLRSKVDFSQSIIIKDGDKIFNSTDVICTGCGLIQKKPSLTRKSLNDFYTGQYLSLYAPSLILGIPKGEILIRVIDNVYFMEWMNKNNITIENKNILNVGSGLGVLSYFLKNYGALVDSVEPLSRASEIAKKLFGISSMECFFEDIDENKKYDTIIFQNSLEHFYSPASILKKARNLLTQSGEVIIEIPDVFKPYPRITVDAWLSSAHMFSYSVDTIWQLIGSCGFEITNCDHSGDKGKMMIRAIPGIMKPRSIGNFDDNCKMIFDMFKEMDSFNMNFERYKQELFSGKDVIAISKDIYSNMRYYSNAYAIFLAEALLSKNMIGQAKDMLINCPFRENESWDIGINLGTYFHLNALIARSEGDFIDFRKLNDNAIENFPPIEKYNIIKEMMMNAMLSESVLDKYHFWSAFKYREQYQ